MKPKPSMPIYVIVPKVTDPIYIKETDDNGVFRGTVNTPLEELPQKGDIFVFNGYWLKVKHRVFHVKEGFAHYVELICKDLTKEDRDRIYKNESTC